MNRGFTKGAIITEWYWTEVPFWTDIAARKFSVDIHSFRFSPKLTANNLKIRPFLCTVINNAWNCIHKVIDLEEDFRTNIRRCSGGPNTRSPHLMSIFFPQFLVLILVLFPPPFSCRYINHAQTWEKSNYICRNNIAEEWPRTVQSWDRLSSGMLCSVDRWLFTEVLIQLIGMIFKDEKPLDYWRWER
jgi:hypothetical protein